MMVAALAGTLHCARDTLPQPQVPDGPATLTGEVVGVLVGNGVLAPLVQLRDVTLSDSRVVIPRAGVSWNHASPLPLIGARLRLDGWLRTKRGRIQIELAGSDETSLPAAEPPWPQSRVESCRVSVRTRFREILAPVPSEVMTSLVIGESHRGSQLNVNLKQCGALHLFAVSGLHLGLLLLILLRVPLVSRLSLLPQSLILLSVLLCYSTLTGTRPPVVRAFLSVALLMASRLAGRPIDPAWVFCVVASLVLFVEPTMATDLGFLMSFSALAGIVFIARPILVVNQTSRERWLLRKGIGRLRRVIRGSLITGVAATVSTIPITTCIFHGASVLSPVSSVLLLPFVVVLMVIAPFLIAIEGLGPLAEAPAYAVALMAEILGRIPLVYWKTPAPSQIALLIHIGALLLAGICLHRTHEHKRGRLLILPLLTAGVLIGTARVDRHPTVQVLDVGDSKAVVCQTGESCVVLAPSGSRHRDAGAGAVSDFLQRHGRRTIDCVVMRYSKPASLRFLDGLTDSVRVKAVVIPSDWDIVVPRRIEVLHLKEGETFHAGSIGIRLVGVTQGTAAWLVGVDGHPVLALPTSDSPHTTWPKVGAIVLPTMEAGHARRLLQETNPQQVFLERNRTSFELRREILMQVPSITSYGIAYPLHISRKRQASAFR